MSIVIMK